MLITQNIIIIASISGCIHTSEQKMRPNILFILADDLGYGYLSALKADLKIETLALLYVILEQDK